MNILSNEQMKRKQSKLLSLYSQGDLKLKIDLDELIQRKKQSNNLFCFNKASNDVLLWIKKLAPLSKKVYTASLLQQQNALFKVLTHIFLLIIYKKRQKCNQHIRDHLKCSLYSDDIDLLELKNHSFNKKMKSDKIKSVMAYFFKEIQYLLTHQKLSQNKIKPEQLIAFSLEKNDMVAEGFHLFYRSILARLEVQDAANCIQQINPEEAVTNIVQYFDINCRIFNDLYLFTDDGVFLAKIQEQTLVFGRYYENELDFQDTSEQQIEGDLKLKIDKTQNKQSRNFFKDNVIEGQDMKNFNFILDTDRSGDASISLHQKSANVETPSFQTGQDFNFGRRKTSERANELETSLSKIKDRLQNEKINQIQSEEQDLEQYNQSPTPFLGTSLEFQPPVKRISHPKINKVIDLGLQQQSQQSFVQNEEQMSTPVLGGGQIFHFGQKLANKSISSNQTGGKIQSNGKISSEKKIQVSEKLLNTKTKKEIRQSAIRRQSYQVNTSSKSKSSGNGQKKQMKTSKNQIQVIDQTASRTSLRNIGVLSKKESDEYEKQRQPTMGYFEKISSYSSCTCHIEKKNRMKLQSHIIELMLQKETKKHETKLQTIFETNEDPKAKQHSDKDLPFRPYAVKREKSQSSREKTVLSPKNKEVDEKRKQFINFLKKDKTQLIKKISQKRNARQQGKNTQNHFTKHNHYGNTKFNRDGKRNFIKQSMFVGSFHNPQNKPGLPSRLSPQNNRSITPTHSLDKKMHNFNKPARDRSKTPPNVYFGQSIKSRGFTNNSLKLIKVNPPPLPVNEIHPTEKLSFNGFKSQQLKPKAHFYEQPRFGSPPTNQRLYTQQPIPTSDHNLNYQKR